jgi:hypothetical protein
MPTDEYIFRKVIARFRFIKDFLLVLTEPKDYVGRDNTQN